MEPVYHKAGDTDEVLVKTNYRLYLLHRQVTEKEVFRRKDRFGGDSEVESHDTNMLVRFSADIYIYVFSINHVFPLLFIAVIYRYR